MLVSSSIGRLKSWQPTSPTLPVEAPALQPSLPTAPSFRQGPMMAGIAAPGVAQQPWAQPPVRRKQPRPWVSEPALGWVADPKIKRWLVWLFGRRGGR